MNLSMNLILRVPAALLGATLVAACTQIPKSDVPEARFDSLGCAELAQQSAAARATKATAEQAKGDAWQAVLPFVVAARYADASSASGEADRRLALLAEQSARRGCGR